MGQGILPTQDKRCSKWNQKDHLRLLDFTITNSGPLCINKTSSRVSAQGGTRSDSHESDARAFVPSRD